MVRIDRAFSWEEFRTEFLYNWIQKLYVIDENFDASSTGRLLTLTGAFIICLICYVIAAVLMVLFYKKVDPRYPNLGAQSVTFRDLFRFDIRNPRKSGVFERFFKIADEVRAQAVRQKTPEPAEKSTQEPPIVASTTPLSKTPVQASSEDVIVASTTPLLKKSSEKLPSRASGGGFSNEKQREPKKTSAERLRSALVAVLKGERKSMSRQTTQTSTVERLSKEKYAKSHPSKELSVDKTATNTSMESLLEKDGTQKKDSSRQ
ncbi:hypothetical protein Q1695_009976 [Nippostrongylus brasiliensis]|nr:hypothetical protein Q1695_009976 [Nippostrongylus brasiliensis]